MFSKNHFLPVALYLIFFFFTPFLNAQIHSLCMDLGQQDSESLGWSVSVSTLAHSLVTGAPFYSNSQGRIIVYTEDNVTNFFGSAPGDLFGYSVNLSDDGNYMAIGAPGNDTNGNDAGQVTIYEYCKNASTPMGTQNWFSWKQIGNPIYGQAVGDGAGSSVSIARFLRPIVAIGSAGNDANGTEAGQVRLFEWDDTEWVQIGQDINGTGAGDRFGYSCDINPVGSRLVVGAPQNENTGKGLAQVYIYDQSSETWIQDGADFIGDAAGDEFGFSVAFRPPSANAIIIGAPKNDGFAENAGQVKVFEMENQIWSQVGQSLYGEFQDAAFGHSVASSLSDILVGAPAMASTSNKGYANRFIFENQEWVSRQILDCDGNDLVPEESLGWSVDFGDYYDTPIVLGAPYYSNATNTEQGLITKTKLELNCRPVNPLSPYIWSVYDSASVSSVTRTTDEHILIGTSEAIMKLDNDGNLIWKKAYQNVKDVKQRNGGGYAFISENQLILVQEADGNPALAIDLFPSNFVVAMDVTFGGEFLVLERAFLGGTGEIWTYFIKKYDFSGAQLWNQTVSTNTNPFSAGSAITSDVVANSNEGFFIRKTNLKLFFPPMQGPVVAGYSAVEQFDEDGGSIWEYEQPLGTGNNAVVPTGDFDDDGCYIAGTITDYMGSDQTFVQRLTTDGQLQWEKIYETDNADFSSDLYRASTNELILVGGTSKPFMASGLNQRDDIFIRKLDADGESTLYTTAGEYDQDRPIGVTQMPDGGIVVAAQSLSGEFRLCEKGDRPTWIFKMTEDGNPVLSTESVTEAPKVILLDNTPNPFTNHTMIRFTLPKRETYEINIFDASGRKIQQFRAMGNRGYNEFLLSLAEVRTSNLLYCQLKSDSGVSVQKLLQID